LNKNNSVKHQLSFAIDAMHHGTTAICAHVFGSENIETTQWWLKKAIAVEPGSSPGVGGSWTSVADALCRQPSIVTYRD
jgi:hypothetical protein